MFILLYYLINKNLIDCICMMTLNNIIEINCRRIKINDELTYFCYVITMYVV